MIWFLFSYFDGNKRGKVPAIFGMRGVGLRFPGLAAGTGGAGLGRQRGVDQVPWALS